MNSRDDRPGYGYILKKGATALTEAWDARANSQDHFMLGHIMEWFYSDLAGIQQAPDSVGWKKIIIKPTPVGDVTWAKAKYDSVRGPIVSDWRVDGGAFKLSVSIPPGTAAVVLLPASASGSLTEDGKAIGGSPYVRSLPKQGDRNAIEIDSGSYSFVAGN